MRHARSIVPLALVVLGGCGGATPPGSPPLGRSVGAERIPVSRAPAPSGDPRAERGGTVAPAQTAAQDTPATNSMSATPQIALRRYALAYTNWTATNLAATERRLASLAVGAARLTAEQIAASNSATVELAANHVQNKGAVLTIAPGLGPAVGQWVVVTQEQTTGTGRYAGLPPTLHVTCARLRHIDHGWLVSEWRPRT
jgi:hypothetical protein